VRCNHNMRRLAPIIALLALFVAAPAAQAKEVTKAQVCGADGCVTTHDPAILNGLMNGGQPTVPQDPNGAVLRLTATVSERPGGKEMGTFQSQWVPSLGLLVAEDGTWMKLPDDAARALDGLGLEPFPAPRTAAPPAQAPAAPADDGGVPAWLLILAALALVGALVVAVIFAQRPPRRSVPT
jgi:hypothetical protein